MENEMPLTPLYAVLAVVILAAAIVIFRRFVPVRREIGDDFFGTKDKEPEKLPPPRDMMPTEDDIETSGEEIQKKRTQAIEAVAHEPSLTSNGASKCRLCDIPLTARDIVEFEEWQRVQRRTGRLNTRWQLKQLEAPGRALHGRHGCCRSCAAIMDHEDKAFETELELLIDTKRRIWERTGRDEAVLRRIRKAEEHHEAAKKELQADDTRRKARTYLD